MITTYVTAGETYSGIDQPNIESGDTLIVEPGGTALSTEVINGGVEILEASNDPSLPAGYANYVSVVDGGFLDVEGGEVVQGQVSQGGTLIDDAGVDVYSVVEGGVEHVENNGVSFEPVVTSGGVLTVAGAAVYSPTLKGGTLDLTAPLVTVNGTISFSTQVGGLLELSASDDITNTIAGFAPSDTIAVSGLSGPAQLVVVGDDATIFTSATDNPGVFNIEEYSVTISGASTDHLELTTANGVDEIVWGLPEVVCFLAGTRIATPEGSRAIDTLAAGDQVLTADGEARAVRWLGRQTVATRFADPRRVAPICIRRGALGEGLPVRDLFVSPDHALMVDDVFVQAGALVNGVSITIEDANLPEKLVYFHVELADHSLILAEGVAAETFIDNVDRLAFDNWDEHGVLSEETEPMTEMPYPRAKAQRQVPAALRSRLMARACDLYGIAASAVA